MGEARQRKLAKAAGQPWPKDAPPPPRKIPGYMTMEIPTGTVAYPSGSCPVAMAAPSPGEDAGAMERMRTIAKLAGEDKKILVVGDDPRGLPVGRRRTGGMDLALLMATMSLDLPPIRTSILPKDRK